MNGIEVSILFERAFFSHAPGCRIWICSLMKLLSWKGTDGFLCFLCLGNFRVPFLLFKICCIHWYFDLDFLLINAIDRLVNGINRLSMALIGLLIVSSVL